MKNYYTKTRQGQCECPKLITAPSIDSLKRKFEAAFENQNTFERAAQIGAYVSCAGLIGLYATEAFAVDIEAAARAGVRPLRATVAWLEPYLLGFAGMAGMYFAEGDLKMRAVKTGIGVGAVWAVSSALLSWMPAVQ